MKIKILSLLFFLCLFSISAFAQAFEGKITQVIDGRTAVLTFKDKSYQTILLQFLEVPEPEQQLSKIVKEHLESLILSKEVRFIFDKNYSQGWIGRLFVGETEVNQQMLRDGAAWYNLPEDGDFVSEYRKMESLARSEKRGVWGIEGLKPAWIFRAEKYALESNTQKNAPKQAAPPAKIILPTINTSIKFIDFEKELPKDFVVVGVGYLETNPEKVVKAIKKAKTSDLVCAGFPIPAEYKGIQQTYSKYCPSNAFLNNAVILTEAGAFSAEITERAFNKAIRAYRLYRITGNYEEFLTAADDAIKTIRSSSDYFPEGAIKNNLLMAADALGDAIVVKSSRDGNLGTKLGSAALLALNDKYNLNDVNQYVLDDRIIDAGVSYLNAAGREAAKLGIVKMK